MDVGERLLHMNAGGHKFVVIPEALTQVAQIHHHDHTVGPVLALTFPLQRVQRGQIALQRHVAQCHQIGQLRQAGDADQKKRSVDACGAAAGHLLQAAGAELLRTRFTDDARRLRHAAYALDNAAYADVLGLAAADHLLRVMIQPVQMYFQTGKLPVHGSHLNY